MSRRVFAYECEGRPEPKTGPRPPQCDDWYSLLVEPMDRGLVELKIAVQANGSGEAMRDWLCELYAVDEHSVSMALPAAEQAKLRDALTAHLEKVGYEAHRGRKSKRRGYVWWACMAAFFFVGIAVGAA